MAKLPPNIDQSNFTFKRYRQDLRYAVQIVHGGKVVKCIIVHVSVQAAAPPPVIKEMVNRKIIAFIGQVYPSYVGMTAVVVGRIDMEI